jgi:hypothetical protein
LNDHEAGIVGLEPFDEAYEAAHWAMAQVGKEKGHAVVVEDAGNMTLTL